MAGKISGCDCLINVFVNTDLGSVGVNNAFKSTYYKCKGKEWYEIYIYIEKQEREGHSDVVTSPDMHPPTLLHHYTYFTKFDLKSLNPDSKY